MNEHCIKTMTDDEFIRKYYKLVYFTVRKYYYNNLSKINEINGLTFEDLFQIGCLELLRVKKEFDPTIAKFTTYATKSIKWAIKNELLRNRKVRAPRPLLYLTSKIRSKELENLPIEKIAKKLQVSKEDVKLALSFKDIPVSFQHVTFHNRDGEELTLEDMLADNFNVENEFINNIVLKEFFNTLSERERLVWHLHHRKGLNQSQIGKITGVSQAHVSRILLGIEKKATKFGLVRGYRTA